MNFKIEKHLKSTPDGWGKRIYLSNLTPGKYSILGYIYDYSYPDYELDIIDEFKLWSNPVGFNIIEDIPDEIANISIELLLSKSIYNINESINGSINISNKNKFKIELEKDMLSQHLNGEHFEINSPDTFDIYGALINEIKCPIIVEAQNYSIIEFEINKIFKLPLISKNISYTRLEPGNYSIFAFFYYGNFIEFVKLNSNYEIFEIYNNKSNSGGQTVPTNPSPTKNQIGSSASFIFYTSIGIIVVIILLTTLFITGTEIGKYGFFGGVVPLYTKTRKKRLDKNYGYKKGLVMGCILSNPGESYNVIKRTLNLNIGSLDYYLIILERDRVIKSERDGMYKRFYPTKVNITKDKFELSNLQKDIYKTIKENLGITQKEISSSLGIAHQTINYHIQLMRDARIIRLDREGKKTKCFIIEEIS